MWVRIIPFKISPSFQLFFLLKFLKIMLVKRKQSSLKQALLLLVFVIQSLCPTLCDPTTTVCQASLSFTISWSLLRLMSIELVMPFDYLILCKVSDTTEHWSSVNSEYHWRINHSCNHFLSFTFTLETKIALVIFACESKTH